MRGIIVLYEPIYRDIKVVSTMETENEYISTHILSLKIRSMGYDIILGVPLNPITPKRHFEHISLFMQNQARLTTQDSMPPHSPP
jgi:hypothetical protein